MISSTTTISIDTACKIMGKNYISPSEVLQRLQIEFQDDDLRKIMKVPYSERILQKNKNSHVLIPFFHLSIREMCEMAPSLFWFCNDEIISGFGDHILNSKTKGGWRLIRKGPVPFSMSKSYFGQICLLNKNERIPDIQTIAFANIVYFLLRREDMIPEEDYVRTSSFTRDGVNGSSRISVSSIDLDGMHFITFEDDTIQYDLGLASEVEAES